MPWWTWASLGFFVLVLVASGIGALIGVRHVRRMQARGAAMAAALDDLMEKAEELERRTALVEERGAVLETRFARLNRSRARLSVLTWALKDATSDLTRLRSVLRK